MLHRTRTIHIESGSDLDRALDESLETPVEIEKDGVRYRLTRVDPSASHDDVVLADEDDIWAGYDPERMREALRRSAGAFRGIDGDQLKADILEQREQDSSGRPA